MRQVWKMALSRNSVTEFELPQDAEFLGGALQPGPEGLAEAASVACQKGRDAVEASLTHVADYTHGEVRVATGTHLSSEARRVTAVLEEF